MLIRRAKSTTPVSLAQCLDQIAVISLGEIIGYRRCQEPLGHTTPHVGEGKEVNIENQQYWKVPASGGICDCCGRALKCESCDQL